MSVDWFLPAREVADGAVRVSRTARRHCCIQVLGPDLDAGRRVTVRKDIFSSPVRRRTRDTVGRRLDRRVVTYRLLPAQTLTTAPDKGDFCD